MNPLVVTYQKFCFRTTNVLQWNNNNSNYEQSRNSNKKCYKTSYVIVVHCCFSLPWNICWFCVWVCRYFLFFFFFDPLIYLLVVDTDKSFLPLWISVNVNFDNCQLISSNFWQHLPKHLFSWSSFWLFASENQSKWTY